MSKINDNALTLSPVLKIENRIRSLMLVINGPDAAAYAAFKAACAATTIHVEKETDRGLIQIIPELKLLMVCEIAAASSGAMQYDTATGILRASVELSDFGALQCFNNEKFKVSISGLPVGYSLDAYAIDAQVNAENWANVYEVISVTASTPKYVGINNTRFLVLPAASLTRLELTYGNGVVITLEPEELKNAAFETNELSLIASGVVTPGYQDYFVYNVADCVAARVTTSADATIVKVDNQRI